MKVNGSVINWMQKVEGIEYGGRMILGALLKGILRRLNLGAGTVPQKLQTCFFERPLVDNSMVEAR